MKSRTQPQFLVGVTGHRPDRMPVEVWPRILSDLDVVLAGFEAEHRRHVFSLVSGLAEGADRLAAYAALGRGWALTACLAFHRSRFEKDFPQPGAKGEFRALLAAATTIHEPKRNARGGKSPEKGYAAAGDFILENSAALIAIWDGKGSRGPGGTVDVIDRARQRGIPVTWINARGAKPPSLLAPTRNT